MNLYTHGTLGWGRKQRGYLHHLGPSLLWSMQTNIMKSYFICDVFQCKKKYQHFSVVHVQKKKRSKPSIKYLKYKILVMDNFTIQRGEIKLVME